jgi:type IV pilus assembly protein PilM
LPGLTADVCFDYSISNKDSGSRSLLVAAKNEVVNSYVSAVSKAGLSVKIVDVDWHALARAINFYHNLQNQTVCVLDVGMRSAHIFFLQDAQMVFMQRINLNGYAEDFLQTLLQDIRQALQMCQATFRPVSVEKFYLTGKSKVLTKIFEYLKEYLGVNVEIPLVVSQLKIADKLVREDCTTILLRSLVSIGLALRRRPVW